MSRQVRSKRLDLKLLIVNYECLSEFVFTFSCHLTGSRGKGKNCHGTQALPAAVQQILPAARRLLDGKMIVSEASHVYTSRISCVSYSYRAITFHHITWGGLRLHRRTGLKDTATLITSHVTPALNQEPSRRGCISTES